MPNSPSEPMSATRSDEVYRRLHDAIVTGRIRPNERLIEAELAEWLEVSRTPIREGLKRLSTEGLVLSRRRGWVVREHTPQEIRQIYEIRAALEGFAARLAADRATETQLRRIAMIRDGKTPSLAQCPRDQLVGVNNRFHDAIVEASGNARIAEVIRHHGEHYFNHRIAMLYSDEEALRAIAQHESITQALLARDGDAAERLAREHVFDALAVTLAKLR